MTQQIRRIYRPPIQELMNDKFIPFISDKSPRYLIFLGGRGSGKSYAAAFIIVMRLLTHKFFRGLGLRKFDKDTKDSIYQTIIDVIDILELREFFTILKSPKSITCNKNGNVMLFGGQNEPSSIKSFREGTFLLFEEECAESYDSFTTMARTFRTSQADFIQVMHCMNPVLPGNPEDHWFYKHFAYDRHNTLSFTDTVEDEIDGVKVSYDITSLQTTFKDNKFLDPIYKLELQTEKDPYKYAVDVLGIWARREVDDRFYKSFDPVKNVGEFVYDPENSIYLGIDFNSQPYSAITLFQLDGKKLYQIDEFCVNDPKQSSLRVALRTFATKYKTHTYNVIYIGDATSNKDDALHEKGYNAYSILEEELSKFKLIRNVPASNPSIVARGEFTNKIFSDGYNGIEFWINKKCTNTINDFYSLRGQTDDKGTVIKKEMITVKGADGSGDKKYEKWGHLSDSATYILCRIFPDDFNKFKNPRGSVPIQSSTTRLSKRKW